MSNAHVQSGKIIEVGEVKSFGKSNFEVREFVIETDSDSKYPQLIKFQVTGPHLNDVVEEDIDRLVKLNFNLRGRRAPDGRVWNNLEAFRVTWMTGGNASEAGDRDAVVDSVIDEAEDDDAPAWSEGSGDEENLPF